MPQVASEQPGRVGFAAPRNGGRRVPLLATPSRRSAHAGRSSAKSARRRRRAQTPRTHKPEGMSLEDWQIALRREFGREQKFKLRKLDDDAIFGEFLVDNPQTRGQYRISIRGVN